MGIHAALGMAIYTGRLSLEDLVRVLFDDWPLGLVSTLLAFRAPDEVGPGSRVGQSVTAPRHCLLLLTKLTRRAFNTLPLPSLSENFPSM